MSIDFKQIPSRLRVPGYFIEQSSSLTSTGDRQATVLHIGYKRGSGLAKPNHIYAVSSTAESKKQFGAASILADMAQAHLAANNGALLYQMYVPMPDVATDATGSINIASTPLADGLLSVRIADTLIQVAVTKAQSETDIASALAQAINASTACWVTATNNDTTVELESKIPGALGNDISLITGYSYAELPPITLNITAMHGGSGAPDLTAALAALGDDPYDYLVTAFIDPANITALDTAAAERWNAMAGLSMEMLVFGCDVGSQSNLITTGTQRNSEFISILGVQNAPQSSWIWAATLVGVLSDRLTNDPAKGVTNAKLPNLKAPLNCWGWKLRNALLYAGVSTFIADKAGNVYIEKIITTYQTNAQGYEDESYLSINVPEQMRHIRRLQRAYLASQFDGYKLTDYPEQHASGQKITSTGGIAAALIGFYNTDLVDERAWCTDKDHYKATIRVERDPNNRKRINYHDEPVMIGQLEIIAGESVVQHG